MFRRTLAVVAVASVALAGFLAAGGPTYAASSTAGIYSGIDGYPVKQLPGACNGAQQPGAVYLKDLLLGNVGGSNLGIYNCGESYSYHREGRAFDWGMNAGNATQAARVNEVLTWLLSTDERGNPHANARRLGIGEIIWNRQIIALWTTSAKTWQPYSGDSAHTDHVHFSFSWAGALKQTSYHRSRNSTPLFALSDSLSSGVETFPKFYYGFGATEVITGDWDGYLGDGIGIFDPVGWKFYLRNAPNSGNADLVIAMGVWGDKPIAGDWDGDGRDDIGVYRPTTQTFYFQMLDGDPAPAPIRYGNAGDLPIIGDWNGDGRDDIGVYRPGNITFYKITGGATALGNQGDIPIVGDWNNDRLSDIGVYRPSTSTFYFVHPFGTTSLRYGDPGAIPVIGDFNGDGQDTQGVIFL